MDDFYEALGNLAQVIHESGIHIVSGIPEEGARNTTRRGYNVKHRKTYIQISGVPHERYFEATYRHVLSSALRSRFTREIHRQINQTIGEELTKDEAQDHFCRMHLPQAEDDDVDEAIDQMQDLVDDPSLTLSMHDFEQNQTYLDEFILSARLYPYDGIDLADFDETVSRVAYYGSTLSEVFVTILPDDIDEIAQSETRGRPPTVADERSSARGFQ